MTATNPSDNLRAAGFMVLAMAIIGVIDNYVIRIAETVSLWQFHALRTTLSMPILLALSWAGLGSLRPQHVGHVALRSLLIASSMMLYFGSLSFMPIGQALAGLFTSPIFILLITALGLRRPLGPWRILAVALGFAGILMVLQPDKAGLDPWMLMPVAAGLLYALNSLATRELCAGEDTLALLCWAWVALGLIGAGGIAAVELLGIQGAPGPDGFLSRGWTWDFNPALGYIGLQVAGSLVGVFLLTRAYQIGETSYIAVFEYSVMIFGPAWAWAVFGIGMGPWQIAGTGLIACAGVIIAIRAR